MKNVNVKLFALSAFGALTLMASSCSKDDPAPINPKLSLTTSSDTYKEGVGTVELDIKLDKAAGSDITISYSFDESYSWSAIEKSNAAANAAYDFEDITAGTVTIAKGQLTGTIQLNILSDFSIERDELIDVVIDKVTGADIDISRTDEAKILLKQENGTVIYLSWPDPTETDHADMDLFIRRGATIGSWTTLNGSANEDTTPGEGFFVPWTTTNYGYGTSYTYYDGTLDPLEFDVTFISYVDDNYVQSSLQQFSSSYTKANINKWTDPNTSQVVQTFNVTKNGISNLSTITPAANGSRVATSSGLITSPGLKRAPNRTAIPAQLKAILAKAH